MKPLSLLKLLLLFQFSLQLFTSTRADFIFTLNIFSHSTSGDCGFIDGTCETFLTNFCLRGRRGSGSRSTSNTDCPLGRNTDDISSSGSITIPSDQPWQGGFQLFFQAFDNAVFTAPDHLSDFFVDRDFEPGAVVSFLEGVVGGRVTVQLNFRVHCQNDYYGDTCSVLCVAQSSSVEGYYDCNEEDGSRDCLDNYYGSACRTECRPSNNEAGEFYTCNEEDGSRVCQDGYTNPDTLCREEIDECAVRPCENGGTCEDMIADFVCHCPDGYTGELCSNDIDECLEAVCPGNSTCVQDALASFECRCNPGFEGDNCTEIQPCESVMCDNGGTCVSEDPFSSECLCPPGFNGTYCENDIDECFDVECENGGTCVMDEPVTFECLCPDGYTGQTCELDLDECFFEEACPVGSLCVNEEPGFRCMPVGVESQGVDSRPRVIIIASAVGGLVILITLVLIAIIILLLARRKMKFHRAERSQSHIYHPGPSLPDPAKCVSFTQEGNNPLYGIQTADTKVISPVVRTFDNSIYDGVTSTQDGAIYAEVRPTGILKTLEFKDGDTFTANVAYESLRSPHSSEAIRNPLYDTSGGNAVSSLSPTYSVPRPATAKVGLQEVDGYTIIKDAGSEGVATPASAVPPPTSSAPSPAPKPNGGLQEVDGYTILKDAGSASAVPSPTSRAPPLTPKPNGGLKVVDGYTILKDARSESAVPTPSYESIALKSNSGHLDSAVPLSKESSFGPESSAELSYAVPATRRCANRVDQKYNTLQHNSSPPPLPGQPVVRLATLPGSGYTALETES